MSKIKALGTSLSKFTYQCSQDSEPKSTNLLTHNAKMAKTYEETGVFIVGLELISGKIEGLVTCPTATRLSLDCQKPGNCVKNAGNGRFSSVELARLRRTEFLRDNKKFFWSSVKFEIKRLAEIAAESGVKIAIRGNTFSDLPQWESIARSFPDLVFFDYTKEQARFERSIGIKASAKTWPKNYFLTYSAHEKSDDSKMAEYLEAGGNISFLYRAKKVPGSIKIAWRETQTVNGDRSDLRLPELDGTGVAVALKGKAGMNKLENKSSKFLRIVE